MKLHFGGRAMTRYHSAEQITNAVWLLMISAALVLGAKSFLTRLAVCAITVRRRLSTLAVLVS